MPSDKSRVRVIRNFFGSQVLVFLFFGIIAGLGVFALELAFTYGLQTFLLVVGLADLKNVKVPLWVPQSSLTTVLLFILLVGLLRAVIQWFQNYSEDAGPAYFTYEHRRGLIDWVFKSNSVDHSEFITLFNERCGLAGGVLTSLQRGTSQITAGILLGVALLVMAPKMTIIAMVLVSLIALPLRWMSIRIEKAGKGLAANWTDLNNRLIISIKNILLIRIYGMQSDERMKTVGSLEAYLRHALSFSKARAVLVVIPQAFVIIIICVISVLSKVNGALPTGALFAYFYLFTRFLQNISSSMNSVSTLIYYWPQFVQLFDWWKDTHIIHPKVSHETSKVRPSIHIDTPIGWKLANIDFSYDNAASSLFQALNLNVSPGSMIVITGPSGAGKTSLLNLMLGENTPTSGLVTVTFNGMEMPLGEVTQSLLKKVGYVGTESFISDGTVYENLVYGLGKKPSEEELEEALIKAECQFVYNLPMGLQHPVNSQGQGLSAGQKQRLSLARALIRKPKALFLDEATSNLDLETEQKLVNTLATLKGEFTIIATTHRVEMLRISDQQFKFE